MAGTASAAAVARGALSQGVRETRAGLRLELCLCSSQAKVSFENETRVMHLASTASYAELLETVRLKFPNAYPFQIKYLDRCAFPWDTTKA